MNDQKEAICNDLHATLEELDAALDASVVLLKQYFDGKDTVNVCDVINAIHRMRFQPQVKIYVAFKIAQAVERANDPLRVLLSQLQR